MKKFMFILMMVMFGMSIMVSCSEIENEDDNDSLSVRQVKKYLVSNFNKSKGTADAYWQAGYYSYYIENTFLVTHNYTAKIYFTKDGYANGYPGVTKSYSTYKVVEENGKIHLYYNDFKYEFLTIVECTKDKLTYKWTYSQEVIDEVNRRKNEGDKFESQVYIEPIKQFVNVYAIDLVEFVGGKAGEQSFWVYYYIRKDGSVHILENWQRYVGWYDECYIEFERKNKTLFTY